MSTSNNTYRLVNPVIEGSFDSKVKSQSPDLAAKIIWSRITKYTSGHVPKFIFSLQNLETDEISSFVVKEDNKTQETTIEQIEQKKQNNDEMQKSIKEYHKNIYGNKSLSGTSKNDFLMQGGDNNRKRYKRYDFKKYERNYGDDDSSDDSDESDSEGINFIPRSSRPMVVFHYTTKFYDQGDGHVFKHESTMNPQATIIDPVPLITHIPIKPINGIITTEHSFTSIPIFNFKPKDHPNIIIW